MQFQPTALSIAIGLSFVLSPVFAEKLSEKTELETIMVTAQKIEQDEQLIPISMSTFSGTDLERSGTGNTYELINRTPNVSMIKAGNPSDGSFISMRGITPTMEGSQTVLFLIDDISYKTFDTDLLDIERVELLRGPQGSLYGRNASSGVINVISNQPEFYSEGSAGITLGNYNDMKATLISNDTVSGSDSWAYRTALQYTLSDGQFTRDEDGKSDVNDVNNFNGRVKLRWAPTDSQWDVITTLQGQRVRNGSTSFAEWDQIKEDSHTVYSDYEGSTDVDILVGSVNASYEGEFINFESISSYTNEKKLDYLDLDFTSSSSWLLETDNKQEGLSQELRWSSKQDIDLRWLGGLYFYNESATSDVVFDVLNYDISNNLVSSTDTNNYAAFGNVTYSINKQWELMSGLRIDHESVDFDYSDTYNATGLSYGEVNTYESANSSYTELLPKMGINYYAAQDLMIYSTIARGYKSGGFNTLTPSYIDSQYDPEYTMNYEIGIKSQWLDNRVQFNSSLFWINWEDQQVEQQDYPYSYTENAANTVSRGIEAELSALLMPGLRVFASGGYNDTYFTDYVGTVYDDYGNGTDVDYSGNTPTGSPTYTYGVGIDYSFLEFYSVYADYNVSGDTYFDTENTVKQSSYGVFNLRTGFSNDRYDITLWVKNLFDQDYVTRAFEMEDSNGVDTWFARSGDARTFGVTANIKW